jgi:hypothetical protein
MKTPLDLGMKSEMVGMEMPVSAPSPKEDCCHYPSLYLDGGPELADIPESGVMEIAFKRTSCTKTDRDGKKKTSVCLDITKILEVAADASTGEPKDDTGDLLDKMAAESEDSD